MTTPALPITPAVAQRLSGNPLMLLLDIDGPLSPIAPHPDDAFLPDETKAVLRDLAAAPEVHVVIVTGRSAEAGRRVFPLDAAWIIGNHGIEVAAPFESAVARDDVARFASAVAEAARR